jgi:hypothetical protein
MPRQTGQGEDAYAANRRNKGLPSSLSISWDAAIFRLRYIQAVSSSFPELDLAREPQGWRAFFMNFRSLERHLGAANAAHVACDSHVLALIFIKPKISFPINRIRMVVPAYPQYCPRQM